MRAAAADAMLGSVGNGALGRLPSGPALGLEPPGSRRDRPRDAAPRARAGTADGGWGLDLASPPKLWGQQDSGPQIVQSENFAGSGRQGHTDSSSLFYDFI